MPNQSDRPRFIFSVLAALSMLAISSCSSGGEGRDNQSAADPPPVNQNPVAHAGHDQNIQSPAVVGFNGLDDSDPIGNNAAGWGLGPRVTADAASASERDTMLVAEVRLSMRTTGIVTVDFMTVDGSAKAGTDYRRSKGQFTFKPGQLSRTIEIPIIADNFAEQDENLRLRLYVSDNATLDTPEVTLTILDDDSMSGYLEGNPAAPAASALVRLPPVAAHESHVVNNVILSRLTMVIDPNATVGEVNAALQQFDARISDMRPGLPFVTVVLPLKQSINELIAVADQISARPGISIAYPARIPEPDRLPPDHAGSEVLLEMMQHLMPTKFPAAWNAASLIQTDEDGECLYPVTVLVADAFFRNKDEPGTVLEASYRDAAATQLPAALAISPDASQSDDSSGHGYDVMATMAAEFDATPPTGAMPYVRCLEFVGIPINGYSMHEIVWVISDKIDKIPTADKFLVNVSLGEPTTKGIDNQPWGPDEIGRMAAPLELAWMALEWRLLTIGRQHDFLVLASAGNKANSPMAPIYPGVALSAWNSPFTTAATAGPLFQGAQDVLAWGPNGDYRDLTPSVAEMQHLQAVLTFFGIDQELQNVLVVGSTTSDPLRINLSESDFSSYDADIFAVGEEIRRLNLIDTIGGTSFSTPQVTGLAAYLWAIVPDLRLYSSTLTRQLIEQSVNPVIPVIPRPGGALTLNVIDAYLAALTLDLDPNEIGVPIIQYGVANVREAILDVDFDGYFDEDDVKKFLWAYYDGDFLDPATEPVEPTVRDYRRYDLNGDGFTGGLIGGCGGGMAGSLPGCTEQFELDLLADADFKPVYNSNLTESLFLPSSLVVPTERIFNEEELTDFEILCYYTFSPLYYGDFVGQDALEARTWLTDCVDVETVIDVPLADVHFASTVQLQARVQETGGPTLVDSEHGVPSFFRWSSSNPDVAEVASRGRMHVTGSGTVTIRASYGRSSTETTLVVPYEAPISDSIEVGFQYNWREDILPFGCYLQSDPSIDEHHWIEDDKVFFDGIILPSSQSVSTVDDPAITWERATGGWPTDPLENAQAGDLILTDEAVGLGFALIDVDYIGQDSNGCWDGDYTVHYYKSHVADAQWPLWELTRQTALPYSGGIDETLWVHITPPDSVQLDAGTIGLNTTSSGAALKIEIAQIIGPDSVNIEAAAPWAIQYLPALNPIDQRENIVVILRLGDVFYEVDVDLTVNDINGERNLVVNDLVGWRCNLGAGTTCAGKAYADVLVGDYVEIPD